MADVADAIIINEESGQQVLQNAIDISTEYLLNDVKTRLFPNFKQRSVLENQVSGYYRDNQVISPAVSGSLKGIQIKIVEWPYLSFNPSSISLMVNYTGDVPVQVWDLIQNKLLDTFTVPAVAGQIVSVNVNKRYLTNGQALNLFIGYDSTGIDGYRSYVWNQGIAGCRACMPTSYGNRFVWTSSRTIPIDSQKNQGNLQSFNDTGGLSVSFSLECAIDSFVCSIRQGLAFSLLHRAAMQILQRVKMSTRVNTKVTLRKEEVDNLYLWFEGEYGKGMDNLFKNLDLPNDICFNCNSRINTGISMP